MARLVFASPHPNLGTPILCLERLTGTPGECCLSTIEGATVAEEVLRTFTDREKAAAAGRKGGAVTAEKRRRAKTDPLFAVRQELPGLMQELLAAARGTGRWDDLPSTSRLQALQKCIEYGIGRPESVTKTTTPAKSDEEDAAPTQGLTIV